MSQISRRAFTRTVTLAAGAAFLPVGGPAFAADKPTRARPSPPPPAPSLPPASLAEADARVQTIVARYGARLSASDRADLTRLSHGAQSQLDRLRAFPLEPADEPAHIFRAPLRGR